MGPDFSTKYFKRCNFTVSFVTYHGIVPYHIVSYRTVAYRTVVVSCCFLSFLAVSYELYAVSLNCIAFKVFFLFSSKLFSPFFLHLMFYTCKFESFY